MIDLILAVAVAGIFVGGVQVGAAYGSVKTLVNKGRAWAKGKL